MKPTLFFYALVALAPFFAACSAPTPYVTTVGILKPGATLAVRVDSAVVNVYRPEARQRRDLFTISAFAMPKTAQPPPPRLHVEPHGLAVRASGTLGSLLVRVPDGVNLVVDSQRGNVNVTDVTGNVQVIARNGNVDVKVPGYARAAVGSGNLSVMMGAATWPGTLHFSTQRGDVEIWISAKAAFDVHLHTDNGVLFTDFGLRGASSGSAETIDGSVNGGSAQRLDVEASAGSIRLLRLQPQP
jgi:hypothetical protein